MDNYDYQYIASVVQQAQKKDSDAFAELYAATYQKCYRFACRYLHDADLAEDALQEIYTLVFKKIQTLRDPKLFISWLNQITFRVCFNMQKKNEGQTVPLEQAEDIASADASPEEMIISVDEKNFVFRQIMGLPSTEAQVIILRYYNNAKEDEIAGLLGISKSSVKRYLASGRKKLSLLVER